MYTLLIRVVLSLLISFLFKVSIVQSQVLSGRFTTSVYSWERQDSPTVSSGQLRVYQLALLKASNFVINNMSIVSKFGYSTDFSNKAENDPRFRVLNLYLKYKLNKNNHFYFGRQRSYSGSVTVAYDGFRFINRSFKNLSVDGYWGTNVPNDRGFEVLDIKENQVLGANISYRNLLGFDASLSYSDIRRLPAAYTAAGEFTNKKVQRQATQERYLGANLKRKISDKVNLYSRLLLNFAAPVIGSGEPGFRHFQKFELIGKYRFNPELSFTTEYIIRRPRLNENSIFWVFNQRNYTELAERLQYRLSSGIVLYGGLSFIKYDKTNNLEKLDDSSLRLNAGFNKGGFALYIIGRNGYSGESKSGGFSYSKGLNNKANIRTGVNYNIYKVNSELTEDNNSTTVFIGITHKVNDGLSGDFDLQYLSQDINSQKDFYGYSNDVRIFARVNYRFRTVRK